MQHKLLLRYLSILKQIYSLASNALIDDCSVFSLIKIGMHFIDV